MKTNQEHVMELLCNSYENLFITGGAGTGKTFVLKQWMEEHADMDRTLFGAPTGVAATNLGGKTLHSLFRIPFNILDPIKDAMDASFRTKDEFRDLIYQIDTLVIDEISMVRSDVLDYIDQYLQRLRLTEEPFGGIRVVFIGDPFQLPPVVTKAERGRMSLPWFFQSMAWKRAEVKVLELTKVYRQIGDPDFAELLNRARYGESTARDIATLNQQVREPGKHTVIFSAINAIVQKYNKQEFDKLSTDVYQLQADVTFHTGAKPDVFKNVLVDEKFFVREGARVMTVKNGPGYYNGSIGTIVGFNVNQNDPNKSIIIIELDTGETIHVGRAEWDIEDVVPDGKGLKRVKLATIEQYPLLLGWAITVHKSQGLSFNDMYFDCERVFAAGQAYVALSRVTTLEGLSLRKKLSVRDIRADQTVKKFMRSN